LAISGRAIEVPEGEAERRATIQKWLTALHVYG
jgi:hypothetical protein